MEIIVAALIAGVPATIAAVSSWKANARVKTNGSQLPLGLLAELVHKDLTALDQKFTVHVQDEEIHRIHDTRSHAEHRRVTEGGE